MSSREGKPHASPSRCSCCLDCCRSICQQHSCSRCCSNRHHGSHAPPSYFFKARTVFFRPLCVRKKRTHRSIFHALSRAKNFDPFFIAAALLCRLRSTSADRDCFKKKGFPLLRKASHTQAQAVVPVARKVVVPKANSTVARAVVPTGTTAHTRRPVKVKTPLPDISAHIIKP